MFLEPRKSIFSGWGRHLKVATELVSPSSLSDVQKYVREAESLIARGAGRSYGDCAVNESLTVSTLGLNEILHWDADTGELIAEAGLMLSEVIAAFLPSGWFPFVTPGTKFVTLGGAIATNVHGKNHHVDGAFGDHVNWIDLVLPSGELQRCSREENEDLFNWTIGGMGLTGIICGCSIQLRPVESGWISQAVVVNRDLESTLASFEEHKSSTYSVAWIDCLARRGSLGRSVLMLGEHASGNCTPSPGQALFPTSRRRFFNLPCDFPSSLLNNKTIRIFNSLYYNSSKRSKASRVTWDSFFYPLDSIGSWNRLYGRKGFFQIQCVLPASVSLEGYKEIIEHIQNLSSGSFLGVLKKLGGARRALSFPMEGYTLALDFKATSKNRAAASQLTQIVNRLGGHMYLAKDAVMTKQEFSKQISHTDFDTVRRLQANKMSSVQSARIGF